MQCNNFIGELIMENRNKFIHCQNGKIRDDFFRDIISYYEAALDSDRPIAVYIKDKGLPELNNLTEPEKLVYIHYEYYAYLVLLNIAKTLYIEIGSKEINKRIKRVLESFNYTINIKNCAFNTIEEIIEMLEEHKENYYIKYLDYLNTGIYDYQKREFPINIFIISGFIKLLKEDLGIKSYFAIVFDCHDSLSKYSQMAINDLIYDTKYLKDNMVIKIICNKNSWNTKKTLYGLDVSSVYNFNTCNIDNYLIKKRKMRAN